MKKSSARTIYHGALRESGAGHLHPLNYCLGLARAAIKAGAVIYENSRVTEVDTGSRPFGQHAEWQGHGEVHGHRRQCLSRAHGEAALWPHHAGGAATSLPPNPWAKTAPRALIRDNEAVANTNFIVDYYPPLGDNRMLFGGRASYSTFEPPNLADLYAAAHDRGFPAAART